MIVTELLQRIGAIYPLATPEALAALKPTYHAHLDSYAGPVLAASAEEVFASFKATRSEPFPKPIDFKNVAAPRAKLSSDEDAPIRAALDARTERRARERQRWIEGQGRRIRETRHEHVYYACLAMAEDECGRPNWRHLTAEQIALCERRALSNERVTRHGRPPKMSEAWWGQLQVIAAEWGVTLDWDAWQEQRREKDAA